MRKLIIFGMMFLLFFSLALADRNVYDDNVIHSWDFDEGAGTLAEDDVGSNDIDLSGWVNATGKSGDALSGGYGSPKTNYFAGKTEMCVSFWLSGENAAALHYYLSSQTSGAIPRGYGGTGQDLTFQFNNTLNKAINDAVYHHLVWSYSSSLGNMSLWVDGAFVEGGTGTGSLTDDGNIYIGTYQNSSDHWAGAIDEWVVFDTACNGTDVTYLYNSSNGEFYPFGNQTAPPPTPPVVTYFQINASHLYNDSQIKTFSAYFTNNNSLISSTTNGTLKTNLTGSLENITLNTTETGGYYLKYLTEQNTTGSLLTNFTPYFYVFNYAFSGQINFSGINYTRNLSLSLNYSCPDFYNAQFVLYFNSSFNSSTELTCNNNSRIQNNSFVFYDEGEYTTGIIFNTSYLPTSNNVKTANQTFFSDLYNPTTYPLSLNFIDGFNDTNGNLSLYCTDTIFPDPFYNITYNSVQIYYNSTDKNTNLTKEINLTTGTNTGKGTCSDLFGSTNETITKTIYLRQILIIDEQSGQLFNVSNLTNVFLYFDDNSSSINLKSKVLNQVNFTSAISNKLRLELEYSNGDIITRFVDVSLGTGDLRICANTDPTTHYEQLIVSATQRRVSLNNVFAQCTVGEDYTRFVYQDSFILRALTRDSIYYLYTYDSDGDKVYLASLDGSISSYYNVDSLEFNLEGYNLDITGNTLTFERLSNTSISIFFKNMKNDSVSTNITIKNQNTSEIYFSVLETDDSNEFSMIFDFATLSLDEKTVLKIELYTYDSAGTETTMIRYFNLSGRAGYLSSPILFVVGILLTIFGLSMMAARSSLGWFGLLIIAASIGVMAFAVMTWYILLMMAIDVIIGAFIGIIMFSNRGQLGVI